MSLWVLLSVNQHIADVHADCADSAEQKTEINISNSYSPVYDGSGKRKSGCIIESQGKIVGYSLYDYICKLPQNEKVYVITESLRYFPNAQVDSSESLIIDDPSFCIIIDFTDIL